MDVMLGRDPDVILRWARTSATSAACSAATDGLQRKYGEHRVIDAPIAEGGIIGCAIGMGVNGLRPVAEIQFADYIYPGLDQIISELARLRYRTGWRVFFAPVTIRTPCGGGIRGGQTHSQSPEGAVHARLRTQGHHAVQSLRRERPADQCHRGRRPGGFLRAEAHLQRARSTATRTSRRCPGPTHPERRGAGRLLQPAHSVWARRSLVEEGE